MVQELGENAVVQCPVCQADYHLKELKNVDQALACETQTSAQLNAALHCTAPKRAQVRYPAQKIECVKQHEED